MTPAVKPETKREAPELETIRPSEALRTGAQMVEGQCLHSYFDGAKACAYGAMMLGYGFSRKELGKASIHIEPRLRDGGLRIGQIEDWNDGKCFSFEEIAVRLEQLGL